MKEFLKNFSALTPEDLKKYYRYLSSIMASVKYGFPEKKLKIIAVTGTSGKSTTTNMIYHVLLKNGLKVGMISTVGAKAGNDFMETGLHVTTPDPVDFKKYLKFMVDKGLEYVVIEASSHALAQKRLGNTTFLHSVITNIKSDHLDWHKTWESYAKAKSSIGLATSEEGKIVLNRDDKKAYDFVSNFLKVKKDKTDIISYSFSELQDVTETPNGLTFTLSGTTFNIPILGLYNIENAMAAINIAQLLGLNEVQIAKALSSFPGLVGRMQIMNKDPLVVVDYAHNTDSLVKSLTSAKKLIPLNGRVISVFGSAGLRDVEKRYTMGQTSAELADITVITAEDPRIEKLYDINSQIIEGAGRSGGVLIKRFANTEEMNQFLESVKNSKFEIPKKAVFAFDEETVDSRFDAVYFAIKIATKDDLVITEGKGHELSLCFGETEYDFTDQEAVNRALSTLGYKENDEPKPTNK